MRDVKKTVGIIVIACVLSLIGNSALAATTPITLDVQVDQTSAREAFDIVNQFRTDGNAWYWNETDTEKVMTGALPAYQYDYALEQIAIQRASELAIEFSHTRPDGKSCYSCTYGSTSTHGENIALGSATADGTITQWKEENDNYDGQGHRRLMLDTSMTCIGIGHVVFNGHHFWAMEVGYHKSNTPATAAYNGSKTATINVDMSRFTLTFDTSSSMVNIGYGDENTLPELGASYRTANTRFEGIPVQMNEISDIAWTSNDTSVIQIVGNSSYKAVGTGSTSITVTGSYKGQLYSTEMPVRVSKKNISYADDIEIVVPDVEYTGDIPRPIPTVTHNGVVLVEGTDYTITYSDNPAGNRYSNLTITGIGNYTGSKVEYFLVSARDIAECEFGAIPAQEYTGSPIIPNVNIYYNGRKLVKDTDYTVDYDSAYCTNVGTGYTFIYGKGSFNGYKMVTFRIARAGTLSQPVQIAGKSLSLEGRILVNFYLDLPQQFLEIDGAKVMVNDREYSVSDATIRNVDGKRYYGYSYGIAIKELRTPITIKVLKADGSNYLMVDGDGNDVSSGYMYSAQAYIENKLSTDKPELLRLIKCLSEYGSSAQTYFSYQTDTIPAHYDDIVADMADVTAADLQQYASVKIDTSAGSDFSYGGTSLNLEDVTMIFFNFTFLNNADVSDFKYYVDSGNGFEEVTSSTGLIRIEPNPSRASYYRVVIDNIVAKDLNKIYKLKVTDLSGETLYTISFSALSYAYSKVNNDKQALADTVRSMYLYHLAAAAYFNN